MARIIIDRGFTLVRPLAGGLQDWIDAGYPLGELSSPRSSETAADRSTAESPPADEASSTAVRGRTIR
ncbi:MAG TPA: hypothetical protein VHL58_09820 [Thermoanaerobaculia bacterium]|nr:hypothetical protein [Thermoanaerobaculia bacterium]